MTENLKEEVQEAQNLEQTALDNEPEQQESDALSRDIVSKIVERERKKAFEKGKREGIMEIEQQNVTQAPAEAQQAMQPPMQQQPQNMGGMQQLSQADIERMIAEKTPQMMQQHMQQQQNEQFVNSFVAKMQAAEQKYPGLEEKLNDLDYSTLSPVLKMANNMENTGDIMNELVENPEKMSNLILLSYTQPKLANKKLMDLSNSIKTNQQALADEKEAQNPMSQLKPSISAGMDNSNLSVTEMRKMFR